MNTKKSLWGELPLADVTRTPTIILREQATILTELTNGLLEGMVTNRALLGTVSFTSLPDEVRDFSATLSIVAPALDGYVFQILQVNYSLELYPVEVFKLVRRHVTGADWVTCKNEQDFTEAVEHILSSLEVREAISKLLAQSKSVAVE